MEVEDVDEHERQQKVLEEICFALDPDNYFEDSLNDEHKTRENICLVCGATFPNNHTLKIHYETHGEGPYSCAHCGEIVNNLKHLRDHIKRHKENKCVICDETFPKLRTMIEHRKFHGDGPFTCKICEKERKNINDLYKHLRNHREKDLVKCKLCPKKMKKTKLKAHMGYHTGRLMNF